MQLAEIQAQVAALKFDRSQWSKVAIGDIVRSVKVDKDPRSSGLERYVAGGHMDSESLQMIRWGTIGEDYLGPAFHRYFKPGQVLFGSRRPYLKKVALADFEGICANTTLVLESKGERLTQNFLPFLISSDAFVSHAIKKMRGSVNPYVNWSDLTDLRVLLPTPKDQARISEVLWAIESLLRAQKAVKLHLSELFAAKCREHFEYSLGRGSIAMSQIGQWLSGGTPSKSNAEYWSGIIPWISPKDMKTDYLFDSEEHVTREGAIAGSKLIPPETVLMVVRGMILAHSFPVCLTRVEACFNQDIKAVIPSPDFAPRYVHAYLKHLEQKILSMADESGHGTKRLPSDALLGLEFPTISMGEQISFCAELSQLESAIELMDSAIGSGRQLRLMLEVGIWNGEN